MIRLPEKHPTYPDLLAVTDTLLLALENSIVNVSKMIFNYTPVEIVNDKLYPTQYNVSKPKYLFK